MESYVKNVLKKAGMSRCNPKKFPVDPKEQIFKDVKGEAVNATEVKSIVGGASLFGAHEA